MRKLIFVLFLWTLIHYVGHAEESGKASPPLNQLKGEVMDVEELKEPLGSAIYTIKDLETGSTVKLYADPYRSLIKIGGATKSTGDVLGGSKVTIIYQKLPGQEMPEVVFAKVTNSFA